uniref:Uncharacterized protein n=1 Tax=Oryza nivara TaxID=4536 RepID=A0A0E0I0N3_ORYNI
MAGAAAARPGEGGRGSAPKRRDPASLAWIWPGCFRSGGSGCGVEAGDQFGMGDQPGNSSRVRTSEDKVRMAGVDPEWSHSMAHALALDTRTWPRWDVPGLGLSKWRRDRAWGGRRHGGLGRLAGSKWRRNCACGGRRHGGLERLAGGMEEGRT